MKLNFSSHARNQMRRRGITEEDVRAALEHWNTSVPGKSAPVCYIGTVPDGRTLQVCLSDTVGSQATIDVVTAYWKS
ncbi:DUF4258 domain-containing protein [Arthrobacter sp. NPDC058127]|uniref:DUF4258 domain-containing protein n=1 Tax=Arthrobacter sp. NPDC058127 TaxID=3346351 RepID=UPI0036EDB4E0